MFEHIFGIILVTQKVSGVQLNHDNWRLNTLNSFFQQKCELMQCENNQICCKCFFQCHPCVQLVGGWLGVLWVAVVPPVQLCHVQKFYLGIFKRGDIESFHRIDPEFERVCFSFPMVEYIVKAHAWGEIYDK